MQNIVGINLVDGINNRNVFFACGSVLYVYTDVIRIYISIHTRHDSDKSTGCSANIKCFQLLLV